MDAGSSPETLQAWLGTLAPDWTAGCPPRLVNAPRTVFLALVFHDAV